MRVVNDLISEGKVLRGFLGVTIGPIDEDMMKGLDLQSKKGVLISFVSPDSPADIAGLEPKDIIVSMNGIVIEDVNELRNKVSNAKPDEVIVFNIIRNKINQNIIVTLGLRPDQKEVTDLFSESQMRGYDSLGFKVKSNSNGEGVIISEVDKSSNAYEKNSKNIVKNGQNSHK
jgi:membrane-associated protease RseP (regulator of RpoE activity)